MRKIAVIGAGVHPWGKFSGKTVVDMASTATRNALQSAGMAWKDVQAVVAGVYKYGAESGFILGQSLASRLGEIGIPITNVYNMCATGTSCFRTAYLNVASGECDIALAVAADISPPGFLPTSGGDPSDPTCVRFSMVGSPNPAYWALDCRIRMRQYGTTETHLAKAKVACSIHGSMNPYARYKRKFTLEEVMNSPMVADPLRLYEICATSDGSAALILCSLDVAKRYTSKPVMIAGVGLGSSLYGDNTCRLGYLSYPAKADAPRLSESAQSSKMAYEQAGMGPEDMDFVELPDNSSWHYLTYLEVLGFCPPGEADRLLDEGMTTIGGKLPVCPSGGLASFGEATTAHGLLQICELFWQLRGEAGERQIKGAKTGISQTYGLMGNSACAILKV